MSRKDNRFIRKAVEHLLHGTKQRLRVAGRKIRPPDAFHKKRIAGHKKPFGREEIAVAARRMSGRVQARDVHAGKLCQLLILPVIVRLVYEILYLIITKLAKKIILLLWTFLKFIVSSIVNFVKYTVLLFVQAAKCLYTLLVRWTGKNIAATPDVSEPKKI